MHHFIQDSVMQRLVTLKNEESKCLYHESSVFVTPFATSIPVPTGISSTES